MSLGSNCRCYRADSRFAPSQWKTVLLCNDVSHWLSTTALCYLVKYRSLCSWFEHRARVNEIFVCLVFKWFTWRWGAWIVVPAMETRVTCLITGKDQCHRSYNALKMRTFLFQCGVLWDIGHVYCEICDIGLLDGIWLVTWISFRYANKIWSYHSTIDSIISVK